MPHPVKNNPGGYYVVITTMRNHGLPAPYMPRWIQHRLCCVCGPLVHGKRYFMDLGPNSCGCNWLSDDEAHKIKEKWNEKNKLVTLSCN